MQPITSFLLQSPTSIEFGLGLAEQVGQRAASLAMGHALLVTDTAMASSAACATVRSSLERSGLAVTLYAEVTIDPDALSIARAAAAYRASGADGIVALGGGSAMDTAKALGALVFSGGDDIVPYLFGGPLAVRGMPPLICLPTTAGTGSEVTFVSVVTHDDQKKIIRTPKIAPSLALIDPLLTVSMPPALTASTGLDALAHASEALTSTMSNPLCDALALDALARIGRWLPIAYEQGDHIEARSEMCLAATAAGLAFVNARVHLGHAVGHSMGTHFKLAHGFACAMCLPAIFEFLRPAVRAELTAIGNALGGGDGVAATAHILERVACPRLGAATGTSANDLPRLVEIVMGEARLMGLSRKVPTPADWEEIFAASL
jgi:alcohol dehydrogenase